MSRAAALPLPCLPPSLPQKGVIPHGQAAAAKLLEEGYGRQGRRVAGWPKTKSVFISGGL